MSTHTSTNLNVVPKLNATNYTTWKTKMEMVLIREKLWSVVAERKLRPESNQTRQADWDDEAERATATIFLCLSESAEKHVQDMRNPVAIWKKLKDVYEIRGFSSRYILWRKLFSLKLSTSIESYIDELTSIRSQLKHEAFEVPDEIIVSVLLNGLDFHRGWDGFITATTQSYRQNADINPDELINQLLDESKRRGAHDEAEAASTAYMTRHMQKHKRSRLECTFCTRSGHVKDTCWIKHPELRPAKDTHAKYAFHDDGETVKLH